MINFLKKRSISKLSLLFLLAASLFALIFAYISQFVFDHQPCILCLHQRKPFFAIITCVLMCLTFFNSENSKKIFLVLCVSFLLINCAISFYHVGVEYKIFQGPATCSSTKDFNSIDNLKDLEAALLETKAIRCDKPTFVLFGLSMAAWNFIYCIFLMLFIFLLKKKFSK